MSDDVPFPSLRIAKLCYHPHPAHKALALSIGAQLIGGWLMSWAKSNSMLRRRLYTRLSAFVAPLDAWRWRGRFDYVIVAPYSLPFGYWIKRWSPQTRLILMNDDAFFHSYEAMSQAGKRYFDLYLNALDGILSGSTLVNDMARRVCDVPAYIFHPFFDAAFFAEVNPDATDVMIVAGLLPHKGILRALETYAALRQQAAVGDLYIAGDGPQRVQIEEKARSIAGVHVLGRVDGPTIRRYLHNALILLHLAEFEAWGVAVLEAAAAGVAPVVTDLVGASECLPRSLVVSSTSPQDEAVAAIKNILAMNSDERDAFRRDLQQTARRFAEKPCMDEFRQSFILLVQEIERRRAGREARAE